MTITELIKESHETAVSKGWWEGGERSAGDQFANFHGEIAEAWEEWRKYGWNPDAFLYTTFSVEGDGSQTFLMFEGDKPEGIAAEFADVLIRMFDTCGKYGIPLEEALRVKMAFNKSRPHRHGGKKA